MIRYFSTQTQDAEDIGHRGDQNAAQGAMLVAVWLLPDGSIDVMSNGPEREAIGLLSLAAFQASLQPETAH